MGIISLQNINFQYESSDHPIFKNISLNIDTSWKTGLIGRNGRGKSTLLKIINGKLAYSGKIISNVNISYFPLNEIDENLLIINRFEEFYGSLDVLWKYKIELKKLGLSDNVLYRSYVDLSGGEKVKVDIAILFCDDNSFKLLDEPTNNLDIDGRIYLENYLKNKEGFIISSHDQYFLDKIVDHVISLNKQDIQIIKGNVSTFKIEKSASDKYISEQNEKLRKESNRLKSVSNTISGWATKKEQTAQSAPDKKRAKKEMKRAKAVQVRTEAKIAAKDALIKNIEKNYSIKIDTKENISENIIFSLRDFSLIMDNNLLFEPINIDFYSGQKLAIEGQNGIGKTSLLNFILDKKPFLFNGEFSKKIPSKTIFVPQQINKEDIPNFRDMSSEQKTNVMTMWSELGTDRRSMERQDILTSDGEIKKLFIANALQKQAELIVFDEVTNFLDMDTIDLLIDVLQKTNASIILIDHNQNFIDKVATNKIKLKKHMD